MKKALAVVLASILCLIPATGCSKASDSPAATASPDSLLTSKPVHTPLPAPSHVLALYGRVKNILATEGFPFSIGEIPVYDDISSDCMFSLRSGRTGSSYVFSFNNSNHIVQKSFLMRLGYDKEYIDSGDLIAIILMATDPALSKETAEQTADQMISLYQNGENKVVNCGEYLVFIGTNVLRHVRAIHKDEVFSSLGKMEFYSPVNYDTALQGKTNSGKQVYLQGSVLTVTSAKYPAGIEYTGFPE